MFYAVIHRPKIETSQIKEVSKKYDPHFGLVDPHVTLVFPFKFEGFGLEELKAHIDAVAVTTQPFPVRLNELELSWDQWLFLVTSKGRSDFERLHDSLYGGILSRHLRSDIEYIPHLALGHFVIEGSTYDLKDPKGVPLDELRYEAGRAEVESYKFDFSYEADSMDLISITDDFTKTEVLENFKFRG